MAVEFIDLSQESYNDLKKLNDARAVHIKELRRDNALLARQNAELRKELSSLCAMHAKIEELRSSRTFLNHWFVDREIKRVEHIIDSALEDIKRVYKF